MNKADNYYIQNLNDILDNGSLDENVRPMYKDGIYAYTLFITQVFEKYNISKNEFPIPTLRKTAVKTGIKEMIWIYQKQSNDLKVAEELGIKWWNEWDIGDGTIGQRYGATIARYKLIDELLDGLQNNPFGRRHIINMYQYQDMNETDGLHPCAYETLWSVRKVNGEMFVDMTLIQRSNDYLMAGFINKIQYVGLMMMVCGHLGYKPGNFSHMIQNLHIYDRHMPALREIMKRESIDVQPIIKLKSNKNFYDYTIDDFEIIDLPIIDKLKSELEIAI